MQFDNILPVQNLRTPVIGLPVADERKESEG
ncbi:hypothetical protein EDF67_102589 [Sphingobacterium sp. JUb78]|jgi:hypothetical protein|nr:hypothetical protein [Sphingobacterium kitahiroshimense]TCR13175.1 hypothetical protein EDF67_102589 [Sphingobacterium sp. JUb78]